MRRGRSQTEYDHLAVEARTHNVAGQRRNERDLATMRGREGVLEEALTA